MKIPFAKLLLPASVAVSLSTSQITAESDPVNEKIKNAWNYSGPTEIKVAFLLKQDGEVAAVKILQSSNDVATDARAISVISNSAPFPLSCVNRFGIDQCIYTFGAKTSLQRALSPEYDGRFSRGKLVPDG